MPSGKKKRRAIRKRKELEALLVNGAHENEDLRGQDEKDGDHRDVGLPASHGNHQTFDGQSEELAKNDTLSVGMTADGNKSAEGPVLKVEESSYGNGDVETLKGLMSNDDSCAGIVSLKEIPPESQVYVKKLEDEESNEALSVETTQIESLIQITDPLLREVTEVLDSMESVVQNSEDMSLTVPPVSAATETAWVKNATDSKMILENERTLVNVVSPAPGFDYGSTKFGAKVHPISTDSNVPAPDSKKQGELLQSLESANCQANDGLEHTEDTQVTEFSEKQPLVAPAPRVTERTSWMNCCGILDLFSGSGR